MVHLLHEYGVRWVLTGSAVLAAYGADLTPNDLDVTPDLDPGNLDRLADALRSVEAIPAHVPEWSNGTTVEQCRSWQAWPATEQNLDHLFVTRLGMLDVPPRLCGSYTELIPEATTVYMAGLPVRVCDPSEVLSRLEGRTRAKDIERAKVYDVFRSVPLEDRRPTGVDRLLERLP